MTRSEFLRLIDDLLDKEPGTVAGPELLEDNDWDSLSVISFLVLAKERCGVDVSPAALLTCKTVDDLLALVEKRLAATA